MSVTLLRAYQGFAIGAVVTFADDTETALVAQGLATAGPLTDVSSSPPGFVQNVYQGGNYAYPPQGNQGYGTPTYRQGPSLLQNIALGSLALTSYETNGVAQTAGTFNFSEIFVPHWNTWLGAGWLNGTTVGTSNFMVALWGTNGVLLANSAVAGALSANASIFQNVAFTSPILLAPGRYFLGVQENAVGADTIRHILAANGSNVMCGSVAGTFGTVPATITVPTTFTTAVAPICQLTT